MSPAAQRRGANHRTLGWLLIPALLLGLLWMHGLATHAGGAHDASSMPISSSDSHSAGSQDSAATTSQGGVARGPGENARSMATAGAGGDQGSAGAVVGLCLAVLAGALIALLFVSGRRRLGQFQGLVFVQAARSLRRPTRARDPDSRSLATLCVVRC